MIATFAWALIKLTALVGFALVAGQRIIQWLLGYIARTGSRDLFTLAVLVLALGIAVGSAQPFGASMALGAFLAGMIVGQSEFSARSASEARENGSCGQAQGVDVRGDAGDRRGSAPRDRRRLGTSRSNIEPNPQR